MSCCPQRPSVIEVCACVQISTAESEISTMHRRGVSAWLGTTVIVGEEHFRGTLDLVRRRRCSHAYSAELDIN